MKFKIDLLTKVFPGKSSAGALGLSSCALIRGGEKMVLFDTGAHGAMPVLLNAFQTLAFNPEDVEVLFLSHLHYDHLNNAAIFPNATIITNKTELKYASEVCDLWTPLESILYLKEQRKLQFVEDGEEFLPGMRAIFTPGHTPGHMSLALNDGDEVIVLAGDSVKNRSELKLEQADSSVDTAASTASIKRIKKMASKVLPGHDGWLLLKDGAIVPQEELTLEVRLPEGCNTENLYLLRA
ncbi:MAG: MBL fold metallo-hydrolase [Sporomusaceae bacterium]|jgi:glyoxylase-like metal-dependent hydrolase (beta-lactamase superfamily II)|nr:MBL fold metallo-hydrolase [Sporomusaceae bacterium]